MSLWSKSVSFVTATINAIKAVTDNIPNGGSMTSIAKTADLGAFSSQTNLKTLLAALGIPDVAGKPLYTLLVTDRLDDVTIGLSAIKAAIAAASPVVPTADSTNNVNERDVVGNKTDTVAGTSLVALTKLLQSNVGSFSGQTNLKTILSTLGVPDVSGKSLYVCLITDRLDNGTYGLSAIKTAVDGVDTDLGDFSARTNLQSLLASLGIPDTAGKPLYTVLVTDRLDNVTYGLSALKTLIDTINTNLGSFTGQTHLQSLLAALGIPDVAGKSLYQCLIPDRLDDSTNGLGAIKTGVTTPTQDASGNANVAQAVGNKTDTVSGTSVFSRLAGLLSSLAIPTEDYASEFYVRDVIGKKTDTVAGTSLIALVKKLTANLGAAFGANTEADLAQISNMGSVDPSSGTRSYTGGSGEEVLFSVQGDIEGDEPGAYINSVLIHDVFVDMTNITKAGTFRLYRTSGLSGTPFVKFDEFAYDPAVDVKGMEFNLNIAISLSDDLKITYESDAETAPVQFSTKFVVQWLGVGLS